MRARRVLTALADGAWHTVTQLRIPGRPTRTAVDGVAVNAGSGCWWCGHPETHDDDNGCQHPGCPCSGLL